MTSLPNFSIPTRTIGSDAARHMLTTAIAHARSKGWSIAVAVVDLSGDCLACARMDHVKPIILGFATDKAYTSAMTGKSTIQFHERMASSSELSMGLVNRPRLLCWEGGLPIVEDGMVLGGIGVSGASGREDAACAEVALSVFQKAQEEQSK